MIPARGSGPRVRACIKCVLRPDACAWCSARPNQSSSRHGSRHCKRSLSGSSSCWGRPATSMSRSPILQRSLFELGTRDRKLLAQFISHLRTQRKAVQQMVLSELTSARYFELIRRLQQAAQAPSVIKSPLTIRQLARREFKKLRKAINRLAASPSDTVLHKVRIKAKRARYAAELARSSVGKPAARFIKSARAIQDRLGIHQDATQAERHIRQFLKYSTSVRAAFLAGRMAERQHHRRETVRKDMKSLFQRLLKRGKKAWG